MIRFDFLGVQVPKELFLVFKSVANLKYCGLLF